MKPTFLSAFLSVLLIGCGGGGDDAVDQPVGGTQPVDCATVPIQNGDHSGPCVATIETTVGGLDP